MARRLMEGSEAIAESMVAAGCRFFAGYPMTPFTEVLEGMAKKLPPVGGVCMNAESELEAVGMAWGAAATGTRAATGSTGQGLSLMQESITELSIARLPLVVLNMARSQAEYWQATRGGGHGDWRRIVLAPMDVAEAVELAQLAFHLADRWRNPVVLYGDYYIAHTYQSVDVAPLDFGPLPENDWALTGATGGSGRARLVSPLGDAKQRDDVGYDLADYYHRVHGHQAEMIAATEPLAETGHLDGAEVVIVAFGTPGKFVRYVVNGLRAEGVPVGYVRPITLFPFPSAVVLAAAEQARVVGVYENSAGQMVDDVRLAVLGAAPVEFIGGLSLDGSAFGIGPEITVPEIRSRILRLCDAAGCVPEGVAR
jgi:2-oxoglutarate/2-oxoacid ferredoxin oxidoreductase subunit alpha